MSTDHLAERVKAINEKIRNAAIRVGRDPSDISLMAASKTVDRDIVLSAIASGIEHIGENQIQEAEAKFGMNLEVESPVNLHMIGHLQTNKVRKALELFDTIQSVDSVRLANKINDIAKDMSKEAQIYLEVNLEAESSKTGITQDKLKALLEVVRNCSNLKLEGLMTVPPFIENPEEVRPYFRKLREIRDELHELGLIDAHSLKLSMGMSHDFEVAIEEGATMVRLGRIIWGDVPIS